MPTQNKYDVVIIGSGVAGALAAYKLSLENENLPLDKKRSILLLEASHNQYSDDANRDALLAGKDNDLNISLRSDLVASYAKSPTKKPISPFDNLTSAKETPSPTDNNKDDKHFKHDVATGDTDLLKANYLRQYGGSTMIWRGNCPRMIPGDFNLQSKYKLAMDWPADVKDAQGNKSFYNDIEPYYAEAEKELGVACDGAEWNEKNYHDAKRSTAFPMPAIIQSYSDGLIKNSLKGFKIADFPEYEKGVLKKYAIEKDIVVIPTPQARNSELYSNGGKQQERPKCQGNANCIPICPVQAKYDATVHLNEALKNGVELSSKSAVFKLTADETGNINKVIFYKWDKTAADKVEMQVEAKFVFIATHGIETPRLLLLSELAKKSGQVGRNLMDHLNGEVVGLFPEKVYPFRGPQGTSSIPAFCNHEKRKEIGAFNITVGNDGWGRSESPETTLSNLVDAKKVFGSELKEAFKNRVQKQIRFSYSTEMLPQQYNQVTLADETDAFGIKRPKIKFKIDDYSRRTFVYAQTVLIRILEKLKATEIKPEVPTEVGYGSAGHIMGTCRMGNNEKDSVVNTYGQCWEHKNLYLLGSSVFPSGGTANPTLTIAALTLRSVENFIKNNP
jgi:glucose dehydrogenase